MGGPRSAMMHRAIEPMGRVQWDPSGGRSRSRTVRARRGRPRCAHTALADGANASEMERAADAATWLCPAPRHRPRRSNLRPRGASAAAARTALRKRAPAARIGALGPIRRVTSRTSASTRERCFRSSRGPSCTGAQCPARADRRGSGLVVSGRGGKGCVPVSIEQIESRTGSVVGRTYPSRWSAPGSTGPGGYPGRCCRSR